MKHNGYGRSRFTLYAQRYESRCRSSMERARCATRGRHERTNQRPTKNKNCLRYSKWQSKGAKHEQLGECNSDPDHRGPADSDSKFTRVHQHSQRARELFENTQYRARQPGGNKASSFKSFSYPTDCTLRLFSKLSETEYSSESNQQQNNPSHADPAKFHTRVHRRLKP